MFLKLTMETPSEKRKGACHRTSSKPQQKRARVQLFRDSFTVKWPYIVPSECDDYAFCKVCDDSFSNAHGGEYQSRAHRGIEQTMKTNSSIITIRQLFAATSDTVDSKVVSVPRATK